MSKFDPSSEAKLEGANTTLSEGTFTPQEEVHKALDPVANSSTETGVRMPFDPPANAGEPRPNADLVHATPRRVVPYADDLCLALAQQSFSNAENYFNAAHRNRVIDAMARFNSEHPKGSKYHTQSFERRSKLFRPKTRATVRKREASACIALFGSSQVLDVRASSGEAMAQSDARIQKELMNYRLQADDRWYKFVVGSVQDADRQGFAIAKTYWEFEQADRHYKEDHPVHGVIDRVDTVAKVDRPGWSLVPVERFFFDPASDWMDPVNSSPFLIEVIPMYLCDVRKYQMNPRAKLTYRQLTDSELLSGGRSGEWNPIRVQRERNRIDRYGRSGAPSDYAVCWVHRNIMRIEGEDYIFDTIGTTKMLSNVMPLASFDPRGYRPYVIGSSMIEAHNPYNVGTVTLMGQVQDEINDTSNLRIDAGKMMASGRMFVKRNTTVDMHALARFSPGAVVELDNPATDVKWDHPSGDISGTFEEQQLLNTELDDLVGNFSQGSVQNNRELNETVGGMDKISETADQLTEYDLRTLCKTFFEKVLCQILDLEKRWETDSQLVMVLGSKLAITARQFWSALSTESKVIVNVGFGNTNPQKKLERISLGMQTVASMFPMSLYQSDQAEIIKEIFAATGFDDVSRFFPFIDSGGKPSSNPQIAALQQQLQTLQMKLFPGEMHNQGWIQREQIRGNAMERTEQMRAQSQLALEKQRSDAAERMKYMELKLAYIELQIMHEKNDIARGNLMMAREKLSNDITISREQLELQRETAMMSPNPPILAPLDPGTQAEAQRLLQPGSALALPDFSKEQMTAGQYAQSSMPASPVDQPQPQQVTGNPISNMPTLVPPPSPGVPPEDRLNL